MYRSCHNVFRELYRKQVNCYNCNYSDTFDQLFLIVMIVVARISVAEGVGVHLWNLPMHNYIALCYV